MKQKVVLVKKISEVRQHIAKLECEGLDVVRCYLNEALEAYLAETGGDTGTYYKSLLKMKQQILERQAKLKTKAATQKGTGCLYE